MPGTGQRYCLHSEDSILLPLTWKDLKALIDNFGTGIPAQLVLYKLFKKFRRNHHGSSKSHFCLEIACVSHYPTMSDVLQTGSMVWQPMKWRVFVAAPPVVTVAWGTAQLPSLEFRPGQVVPLCEPNNAFPDYLQNKFIGLFKTFLFTKSI